MVTITTKFNERIQAKSYSEAIGKLAEGCRTPSQDIDEFKRKMSKRHKIYYGFGLNTANDMYFLYGLRYSGEIINIV